MTKVTLKRGDTRTAIKATLVGDDGNPVDLTETSVRFLVADFRGTSLIARQAGIVSAAEGKVLFAFEPGETDTAGTYRAEFEATYLDGRKQTYPNDGYISIEILPDLG
jgi:hypothetical protein